MRFFLLLLGIVAIALFMPNIALAESTKSVQLHANVVDYYSDRFILTADGSVSLRFSDGTIVTGRTFSIDLKLNRFVIAGDVHINNWKFHAVGAALSVYPDLDRMYFLTDGPTPDRWTFYGLDFSNNHPGRQMPGDAFFLPDLTGERPYIISNGATIFLRNNVEFPIGSRISVLGLMAPTPGYVVNFSSNPNFYQNGFAGAEFDIGIPFHGAADASSAFHLRYEQYRGLYTSFDQHFVRGQDYAVFAVNPLTQNARQWNAILYKKISPAAEARFFFQLSTLSQFLNEPSQAGSFANLTINTRVGKYAVGLSSDQFNASLLPNAPDVLSGNGQVASSHPFDSQLSVQSFEDEIRAFRYVGVPIKFTYRAGFGLDHDDLGIAPVNAGQPQNPTINTFGGVLYKTIWQKYIGATVYTAPVRLAKQVTISAKADQQRQWYSLGHHVVTTDFSATIARTPLSVKLPAFFVTYDVYNLGDYYGALQSYAYDRAVNNVPGAYVNSFGRFTGLDAFRGFATQHSYTGQMVYTPTPYFNFNTTLQRFYSSQSPVPGLGGQVPWALSVDVRVRISHNILVDVGRQYYFNFGNQLWSPQFTVQFSP